MTYSQIWNTIEHLFSENAKLAGDANEFFGVDELDEILTKDSLRIRFRKLTNTYEVTFNSPLSMISFVIKKFANTSYQRSEYELFIRGGNLVDTTDMVGSANDQVDSKDISFFVKYVRDWKLKNILK